MKQIIITTQKQLDKLREIKTDEEVIIKEKLKLNYILDVYGRLIIETTLECNYWNNKYIKAYGNSSIIAYGNSSVTACGNSSITACDSSSVTAYGNSSVIAYGNSLVRVMANIKLSLFGFSVAFVYPKVNIKIKKSKTAYIQRIKSLSWFENNDIEKKPKIILFKKVSKDFKTQEGTFNETLWEIGSIIEHKSYKPEDSECGDNKFHAVSRPFFADEFRSQKDDKYIAIEIKVKDLYEWKNNPQYPHKIGFRKCKVLYECDMNGEKI